MLKKTVKDFFYYFILQTNKSTTEGNNLKMLWNIDLKAFYHTKIILNDISITNRKRDGKRVRKKEAERGWGKRETRIL